MMTEGAGCNICSQPYPKFRDWKGQRQRGDWKGQRQREDNKREQKRELHNK